MKKKTSGKRKVCLSNHFLWYLDFGLTSFLLYLFNHVHQDMIHYLWYVYGMFVLNLKKCSTYVSTPCIDKYIVCNFHRNAIRF